MKSPLICATLAVAALSNLNIAFAAEDDVPAKLQALDARLDALEAENRTLREELSAAEQSAPPTGDWTTRSRIGGYGELHYNNLDGEGGASAKEEFDLHRFVLFFGHTFNARTRFFSELEVEHSIAGEGKNGEVELEQAYVEYDLNPYHRVKGGVFLLPVGLINETHEPPTFYGVERNPIESNIIPATWWAGGAAFSGELGRGFGYDLAVHEGLAMAAASAYGPRSGRQKTSNAKANDLAYTARLKWTGVPGVEMAGSVQYQSDMTQVSDAADQGVLAEVHGVFRRGPLGLKALYAQWTLDGAGPESVGADKQVGWYVEPSLRLSERWGVFARYNAWDNRAGDAASSGKQQVDAGVNFWPHSDVVVKADYQRQDNDDGKNQNGFNVGVGYQF